MGKFDAVNEHFVGHFIGVHFLVDGDGNGDDVNIRIITSQELLELLLDVLDEIIRTSFCPILGIVELSDNLVTAVSSAGIQLAMSHELIQCFSLDGFNNLTCSLSVHKVTHVNTALVDEQIKDVRVFEHVLDKACGRFGKGPFIAWMIVRIIEQVDHVVSIRLVIESKSEVGVLGDDAPTTSIRTGTPEYGIVARPVVIAIKEVHDRDVQIFAYVQPFLVFCQGVNHILIRILFLLAVEGLKGIKKIPLLFSDFDL